MEEIAAAWRDADFKDNAEIFGKDDEGEEMLPDEARELVPEFDADGFDDGSDVFGDGGAEDGE